MYTITLIFTIERFYVRLFCTSETENVAGNFLWSSLDVTSEPEQLQGENTNTRVKNNSMVSNIMVRLNSTLFLA